MSKTPALVLTEHDWLNHNIDCAKPLWDFLAQKVTVIRNVMKPDAARMVKNYLTNHFPKEEWYQASSWGEGVKYVPVTPENQETIKEQMGKVKENWVGHGVVYTFQRTLKEANTEDPNFVQIWSFLRSRKFLDLVEKVTMMKLSNVEASFVSRYTTGCALSIHTDVSDNRKLAFVLNLTEDWKEEYGGCLVIEPEQAGKSRCGNPSLTIVPEYNTLSLFDVTNGGRAHYVSEVVEPTGKIRMAITGWLY